MYLFAYGEYDATTFWGMFAETLPLLLRWLVLPTFAYCLASALAERFRIHAVGIAAYLLVFFLMASHMQVSGAWGPAHVAMEIGFWAWPVFFLVLFGKTASLYLRRLRLRAA